MEESLENNWDYWSTQPPPSYQPTGRPLAEPPIFDYEHFMKINRNEIPSDGRLKRLFAKDIGMGYRWRDEMTEDRLLKQHTDWADDLRIVDVEPHRRRFYDGLYEELCVDIDESHGGADDILREALQTGIVSGLGLWEFKNLDEDGGTEWLQQQLETGFNVFEIYANNGRRFQDTPRYRKKWSREYTRYIPRGYGDVTEGFFKNVWYLTGAPFEVFEKYDRLVPPTYFQKLCESNEWLERKLCRIGLLDAMLKHFRAVEWLCEELKKWCAEKNLPSDTSEGQGKEIWLEAFLGPSVHYDLDHASSLGPHRSHRTPSLTESNAAPPAPDQLSVDASSLQEELFAAKSENATLRKRIAEFESPDAAARRAKHEHSRHHWW